MGGVQRAAKLAKYLPEFGWNVTVLTVRDISYYNLDPSLLEDIRNTEVVRTGSLDPLRISRKLFPNRGAGAGRNSSGNRDLLGSVFRFIDRKLFVPDSKVLWNVFASMEILKLMRNRKFDLIISTGPPFSSHLLGMKTSMKTGLPWIADFRDGWTNRDIMPDGGLTNPVVQETLEQKVIKSAAGFTAVSEKILNHLSRIDPGKSGKLIYNGFDSEDFEDSVSEDRKKFRITYAGTVTEWTDPSVMFGAISKAIDVKPEIAESISIEIVGTVLTDRFNKRIQQYGLWEYIKEWDYLPHRESVKALRESSLLLFAVTVYNTTGMITGKIFEYLASGIPILAHSPDGEAIDILTKFCPDWHRHTHETEDESARYICDRFEAWKKQSVKTAAQAPRSDLSLFERKQQAQAFAGYMDSVLT